MTSWRTRSATVAVMLGITTSALMQTVLATAMPQMAQELGSEGLYGWVFASYLLASTITLPTFGQLADRWGSRPVFLTGIGCYALGTALTAAAISMPMLIAARLIQGLGAGALVPAALAVVASLAGREGRGSLFGTIGVIQVLSSIVGPVLGGWFTDGPGWRWSLWVVVPFAAAAGVLARLSFPRAHARTMRSAVRGLDPWQPLRQLCRGRTLQGLTASAFALGIVLVSATALVPLLAQNGLGRTATESGVVLVPLMVGVGLGSIVGGRLAQRAGPLMMRLGWVAIALGACTLAVVSADARPASPVLLTGIGGAVVGLGIGSIQPTLLIRTQDEAAPDQVAAAGALVPFARNLGGAAGTAALGLVMLAPSLTVGIATAFAVLVLVAIVGASLGRWRPV
ncbi:MAG: MFS transporter [Beutenbergiaceae bacterium]